MISFGNIWLFLVLLLYINRGCGQVNPFADIVEESLPKPGNHENSDKKIAFLFLTRGPMPLEDVWREFFRWRTNNSHYNIYIHPHGGYKYTPGSIFHGKEVYSSKSGVTWGGMSQVRAIRRLVAAALEDPLNEWFCLMSESCIPLVPMNYWRNSLLSFNKSVINACAMSAGEMETDTRWRPSLDKAGLVKANWRKSATWFALTRKHASIFANVTHLDDAWESVLCCDEHFLPTLLAYHGLDNETTCSDGFVHVSWPSLLASHPRTYGGDDISPQLFATLHKAVGDHPGFGMQCSGVPSLCHFTARKFSPYSKHQLLEHMDMILDEEGHPYTGNPWDHHPDKLRINSSDDKLFVIENDIIRQVPDRVTEKYMHLGRENVKNLTFMDLEDFRLGPPIPSRVDGQIIRGAKQRVIYLMKGGHRHGIPNLGTFIALGFDLDNVTVLHDTDIEQIPMGDGIPPIKTSRRLMRAKRGQL